MRYVSTRGGAKPQPFTEILLEGLAPDGGLYLPEEFPKFGPADLSAMRGMSYAELAFAILSRFADDIPPGDLKRLVDATYTKKIFSSAVRGVFDDCQDIVKAISGDFAFKARHRIGVVNSINWARVAAQVVYYFKAYFAVGGEVSFAVPSGNFGNVYAGHVARSMGLPIRTLIVATNENDVLDEFFRTGRYRVRKAAEVKATSSPSMDISKSSNFERYAYDLVGRDPFRLKSLWAELDANGVFALAGTEIFRHVADTGFVSGSSTHADRLATIRRVWKDYGVMIDPHTADGIKVRLQHPDQGVPLVCMETAQPAKFAETIREALGREPSRPAGFENLEKLPQRFEVMDADVGKIKHYIAPPTLRSAWAQY